MSSIKIVKYSLKDYHLWNNFVAQAKNATFLFHRDYMEYHKDRFEDFSLMIFEKEELIALLPAHISGDKIFSHNGLTYGGLICQSKLRTTDFVEIFYHLMKFLHENAISQWFWKEIPNFYTTNGNDELKYLTFVTEAKLYRRDLCSVIDLKQKIPTTHGLNWKVNKAKKAGAIIEKSTNFSFFWNEILSVELLEKYGVKPVHSLEEIQFLHDKFPENIHLYTVKLNDEIVAGTVLYIDKKTVHCQYISVKKEYRNLRILDFLFHHLIFEKFSNFDYFDFGISNEENGKKLNKGLMEFKENFGARSVSQDFYQLETKKYSLIESLYL
ncbi:GNAT family N-acetyltransferase [Capnocytophaga sp. ARDL2]|uniref:GNAT family N-acetyltransferase n=1 Tax=Capnocytophaga sp. ARDL2 TaxID=3238809 RepID=UPI003555D238